jgi:hypothetical protein
LVDDEFPPQLSPVEAAEFRRRRRGRNIAMLVALLAVAALFYVLTFAKLRGA